MIIGQNQYDRRGELLLPSESVLKLNRVTPGGRPTIDVGYQHRFKISGSNQREVKIQLDRFLSAMQRVNGYHPLVAREYVVNHRGYHRVGVDIVYGIEEPAMIKRRERLNRPIFIR